MKCMVPENRKFIYLPALNSSLLQYNRKVVGADGREYVTNWWSKDSPFCYDQSLICAYYGMQVKGNFRESFGMPKDYNLLSDSGGFQAVTLQDPINPIEVLQWEENNSEKGLILDRPPYEFGAGAQFSGNIHNVFEQSLKGTAENSDIMLRNKKDNFNLFGVVQGESPQQMLKWYNTMIEIEEKNSKKFGGWALSPKPSNDVMKIAMYGILAIEKLNTPIHILQVSSFDGAIIGAYISSIYKNIVTMDSSSYMIGIRYGQATDDWDIRNHWNFGRSENKSPTHFSRFMSCSPIGQVLANKPTKEYSDADYCMINMHNLYKFVEFFNYLEVLSEDRHEFVEFAKKATNPTKVLNAIEMIDYGVEYGLEKAYERFKDKVELTEKPVKQSSVFRKW